MAHPLLFDGTWLQQGKYESAEAFYQQVLAGAGGDNSPQKSGAAGGSKQTQSTNKSAASTLKSEIAQARQNIKQALDNESGTPAGTDSQVLARIKSLETENNNLKQVAQDLQALVKKLDARVSALEKGGAQSGTTAAPTPESKPIENAKDDDDSDEFDPFADDDDESEDEETKKRLAAYHARKAAKPAVIAKSSLGLDVKPWDDETDMKKLEECVRSITMDGLLWGQSKLLPVGYGIKKLQINAVVEDDKVSTDDLEEKITAFEDYVQSMDIAYFNKI